MSDVLSMTEAAELVGLTRERLRKVWKRWVERFGFPAPFKSPPLGEYAWRRAAVLEWREAREHALGAGRAAPAYWAGAQDPLFAHRRAAAIVSRQRAQARALLMEEA